MPKLCGCIRKTVCDILLQRTQLALERTGCTTLALAGGVSANSELRARMRRLCEQRGVAFYCPPLPLCGDNAAMIGVQAGYELAAGHTAGLDLNARATMDICENPFSRRD